MTTRKHTRVKTSATADHAFWCRQLYHMGISHTGMYCSGKSHYNTCHILAQMHGIFVILRKWNQVHRSKSRSSSMSGQLFLVPKKIQPITSWIVALTVKQSYNITSWAEVIMWPISGEIFTLKLNSSTQYSVAWNQILHSQYICRINNNTKAHIKTYKIKLFTVRLNFIKEWNM